jgi:uncharacterized protein YbjT (DUF2867 family)
MYDTMNHSSSPDGITLVIGGTGKTGRRVAERLLALGRETRIASRSTTPAFDWNDQSTWGVALAGVSAAYITYAPDLAIPGAAAAIRALVALAVEKGVQRLVLLSGRGEEEAQACERIVQESGVTWTIVRAGWFNQNFSEGEFLGMVLDGAITLPAANIPEPFVDVEDIAQVAVAALTEAGHDNEVYEVTGPRLLTFTEVAREISEATGREVRFVQVSREAFAEAAAESGAPDGVVWLLNYLFETVLDGRNAHLGDGVQRALGREPMDFADYARRIGTLGTWNPTGDQAAA